MMIMPVTFHLSASDRATVDLCLNESKVQPTFDWCKLKQLSCTEFQYPKGFKPDPKRITRMANHVFVTVGLYSETQTQVQVSVSEWDPKSVAATPSSLRVFEKPKLTQDHSVLEILEMRNVEISKRMSQLKLKVESVCLH